MKVAMLTYSTKPRGGVVHALSISEALLDLGVDVHLFSLRKWRERAYPHGFFRKTDVPFDIFPYRARGQINEDVKRMISTYDKNLSPDFDIYHTQDCIGGNALSQLKVRSDAPTVRTIHHVDEFRGPALTKLQEDSIRLCDIKVTVSKYWQRRLKVEYGVNSTVIYNGVDLKRFDPGNYPKPERESTDILFVGGLEARKGLEHLFLAVEKVVASHPDTRLTVLGRSGFASGKSSDERRFFSILARRLGIGRNVRFIEQVDDEQLPSLYALCDVFVLPSRMEGWGLALMEAMAMRKPVIATRVGGIPELLEDGKTGYLLEPGDVLGLSEAVSRLIENPSLRKAMGREGRETVKAYTWESSARKTLELYEKALAESA
ncbi:MAG: MSMEG_0565 family glycosyltransferase [Thermoplasmata archaeon]